uniref:DENN/MADD domain containing 1B n=1 Tax=Latimeria chalumnae TaxID=7897 RepID=H3AKJ7_LATCH
VSTLKSKLKKQSTATGDGVARAFLRAQAALFGAYRDALRYKPGEPITFCEESFVNPRSSTMKHFLEGATNLQLFKQFIEGRLVKLNTGRGFSDAFEEEITLGGYCGGNSKSYQQWMHTVKVRQKSGAFFNTAVTKASPAVKTMYKFAKNHAKQGIKEMKSMLKQKESDEEDGPLCVGSVPYTKSPPPIEQRANSEKRRLAQFTKLCHLVVITDGIIFKYEEDHIDSGERVSRDFSGIKPVFFPAEDTSIGHKISTNWTIEVCLINEIISSLAVQSIRTGQLFILKSLDTLRTIKRKGYKASTKKQSSIPSENNLAQLCGSSIEPVEWNLGQDDSALHGMHLPPSPRRKVSSSSCREPLFMLEEEYHNKTYSCDKMAIPKIVVNSSSPKGLLVSLEDSDRQETPLPSQEAAPSPTLRKHKVSTGTSEDESPNRGQGQPSVLIPWEKQGENNKACSKEKEVLDEIVQMCDMDSAFHHSLNISEVQFSSNSSGKKA